MKRMSLLAGAVAIVAAAGLITTPATAMPNPGRVVTVRSSVARIPRLGVPRTFGPSSTGWGRARPHRLFNGGDPSGTIRSIHWGTWGGTVARGHGRTWIPKPTTGYYAHTVRIRLRARDLGTCASGGRATYRRLWFRVPSKPGGKLGPWRRWTSYHRNLCTMA